MEFFTVLIPIFFIFGIGFVGQKIIGFDIKPLSQMAIYLMTPFLAFRIFYEIEFNLDYILMTFYTVALVYSLIGIIYIIAWIRGYSNKKTCGMILASAFMNNGNYGTPLILFAFGEAGMKYAVILMVIQQLLMCTVGVYYAAKGASENTGIKTALNEVIRVPVVYGALLGIIFHLLDIRLGETVMDAVSMVGNAAIPTIMIILGMQLAKISVKKLSKGPLTLSLVLRLILSPAIAWVFTLFMPVDDLLKQIMIVLAAMPSAANTTMYALQYGTEPEFVSSATLFSTLLSLITLPLILYGVSFL
jgi:malate permease and related proteins